MKKLMSLLLSLTLCMGLCIPAFAYSSAEEGGLVSIEVIPNEELIVTLPDHIVDGINEVPATRGWSKPDGSRVWDLLYMGTYGFGVDSSTKTIWSDYVFTGHMGDVNVYLNDIAPVGDSYTFTVYKMGSLFTTLYEYTFPTGAQQRISLNDIDLDSKLYFSVNVHGIVNLTGCYFA